MTGTILGTVDKWMPNRWGWVWLDAPISLPDGYSFTERAKKLVDELNRSKWRILVRKKDLIGVESLSRHDRVQFSLYCDDKGLGAQRVRHASQDGS